MLMVRRIVVETSDLNADNFHLQVLCLNCEHVVMELKTGYLTFGKDAFKTYFARHFLSFLEDRLFYVPFGWMLEHTLSDILCLTLCFLNQLQILFHF